MNLVEILIAPLTGAAIGYSTNWLAIKMLFRPHTEKYIFGFRLPFTPGILPKGRVRLAKKLGETVSEHLLTPEVLTRELTSSPLWQGIQEMTLEQIFEQWGLAHPTVYAERGIAFIRGKISDDGENNLLSRFVPAVKSSVREYLPRASQYACDWAVNQPDWDKYFEELTEKVIQENFGYFIGSFINHKKIYASIKDGLLTYLSKEDNLERIADKIEEAVDHFCDGELNLTTHLPNDSEMAEKLIEWAEKVLVEAGTEKKAIVKRVFENAAAYVVKNMDIKEMVERRANEFTPAEAEKLVLSVVKRELNIIMTLGGILGFIIGFIPLFMK